MVDVVRDRISSDAAIAEHIANGEFDQISPEAKEKIAEGVVELMHGDTSVDIPVKENIDVIVTKDKDGKVGVGFVIRF